MSAGDAATQNSLILYRNQTFIGSQNKSEKMNTKRRETMQRRAEKEPKIIMKEKLMLIL